MKVWKSGGKEEPGAKDDDPGPDEGPGTDEVPGTGGTGGCCAQQHDESQLPSFSGGYCSGQQMV